jgi:acyl carrier protein
MPFTPTQVSEIVVELLQDFEGRQYSAAITRDTYFFADLGFASIDAIVLGEHLEQRFAQPIPFASFLSGLAQSDVNDISVGQLIDFLNEVLE